MNDFFFSMAIILMAYVAYIVLLINLQEKLIFRAPPKNFLAYEQLKNQEFSVTCDNHMLQGWRISGSDPESKIVVIYFGGNGDDIANSFTHLKNIPARSIYALNYRGYGLSDGTPSEKNLYSDALYIFDKVKSEHPNFHLGVMGYSLGSAVAGYIAAHRTISFVIFIAPLHSISKIAKGNFFALIPSSTLKNDFNLFKLAPKIEAPTLVICGAADATINNSHSYGTYNAIKKNKEIINIEHCNHNSFFNRELTLKSIDNFFRKIYTPDNYGF